MPNIKIGDKTISIEADPSLPFLQFLLLVYKEHKEPCQWRLGSRFFSTDDLTQTLADLGITNDSTLTTTDKISAITSIKHNLSSEAILAWQQQPRKTPSGIEETALVLVPTVIKKPRFKQLEAPVLRIIIHDGRGLGHQATAIDLMKQLRELGFKGIFDVRYTAHSKVGDFGRSIARRLEKLIAGFTSPPLQQTDDPGQDIDHPDLGHLHVTRLPRKFPYSLPPVKCVFSAASDYPYLLSFYDTTGKKASYGHINPYGGELYLELQPPGWEEGEKALYYRKRKIQLPYGRRYSVASAHTLSSLKNINKQPIVQILLDLLNPQIMTQLVYGIYSLYDSYSFDVESVARSADEALGHFDPLHILTRLLTALYFLQDTYKKPIVIIAPQKKIADYFSLLCESLAKRCRLINLTEGASLTIGSLSPKEVVVLITGVLPHELFQVVASRSSLPPVVEGCNSTRECVSGRIPYLKLDQFNTQLMPNSVPAPLQATHTLFKAASLCLQKKSALANLDSLAKYMKLAYQCSTPFTDYIEFCQNTYLEQPDACEIALGWLNEGNIFDLITSETMAKKGLQLLQKTMPKFTWSLRKSAEAPCYDYQCTSTDLSPESLADGLGKFFFFYEYKITCILGSTTDSGSVLFLTQVTLADLYRIEQVSLEELVFFEPDAWNKLKSLSADHHSSSINLKESLLMTQSLFSKPKEIPNANAIINALQTIIDHPWTKPGILAEIESKYYTDSTSLLNTKLFKTPLGEMTLLDYAILAGNSPMASLLSEEMGTTTSSFSP